LAASTGSSAVRPSGDVVARYALWRAAQVEAEVEMVVDVVEVDAMVVDVDDVDDVLDVEVDVEVVVGITGTGQPAAANSGSSAVLAAGSAR
jgi:hypothetical protein